MVSSTRFGVRGLFYIELWLHQQQMPVIGISSLKISRNHRKAWILCSICRNVGDALTFKILKNDLVTVLHRSVVTSAADASHRNRRVSFKSDVQESIKLLSQF
jgi:hypothetical protein